jgi:hypothetical protein
MVALFIGSICSIWHNMLTTVLFRYSGMGKTPAIINKSSYSVEEHIPRKPENTAKSVKLTTLAHWPAAQVYPSSGDHKMQPRSKLEFKNQNSVSALKPIKFGDGLAFTSIKTII